VAFSPIGMMAVYATEPVLRIIGVHRDVVPLALPYAYSLQWELTSAGHLRRVPPVSAGHLGSTGR
jgi:hypothetical protein